MSNTDKLRAAAQQALETLEQLQGGCTDSGDGTVEAITVWCPEVIDALRASLAQPAQPAAELQRRTGEPHIDGWPLYSGLPPPAASGEPANTGWLQERGLLYRLTDDKRPQNRDEIRVAMADGSRSDEACTRRAGELLDRINATAQPAPAPANDRPTRADFVRVARCFALAYGLHADAPDYLPRTDEARDAFEPHAWVIALAMQAHHDGRADGLSQPAPALVPPGWQPIETAPDGDRRMFVVIAANVAPTPTSRASYTSDPWCVWRDDDGGFARWPHAFEPTHWMPLPAAPSAPQSHPQR